MRQPFRTFIGDERGASAVEYAFVAGAIALIVVGGASLLGLRLGNYFSAIASRLP